jgi:hypothetical protein
MNTLVSTLTDGTVHVWEVAIVAVAFAFRETSHHTAKTRQATPDSWTLKDIGVEPGSITWVR